MKEDQIKKINIVMENIKIELQEQIKKIKAKKETPKIPPDLAMPKAKPFSFKDAYAWASIVISLALFAFTFLAVGFLYKVTTQAFQIREDVINSQVVEYNWEGYQKVADKLGIQ